MKTSFFYKAAAAALAFAMSGVPSAFARADAGNESTGADVNVGTVATVPSQATTGRERAAEASGAAERASESALEHSDSFLFEDEASTTAAADEQELEQSIEEHKHEIEDRIASSTAEDQSVLEDASSTAVAVHALLVSRNLLGGVGDEVSQIAHEIDRSLATTTDAQARIRSRGFWTRLFFGGDAQAAGEIAQAVQETQQHAAQLSDLLDQASTTAGVKATLEAQVQIMEQAQHRLQEIVDQQNKLWGIFSWRF